MLKRSLIAVGVLAIVLVAAGAFVCLPKYTARADSYVYLRSTCPPDSLYARLDTLGSGFRPKALRLLAKAARLKSVPAGRYRVDGLSTLGLLRKLRNGQQDPMRYNIPVVWTPEQFAARLGRAFCCDSAQFATVFKDTALCRELGFAPEEIFCHIPADTYEFYWTISPQEFLKRMAKENTRYWTDERKSQAAKAGLSPEEAVVLASIVERETANAAEKPTVAGLYLNRLKKGMKLQADPTVKYAVGDFGLRRILKRHLATDSPYNTYRVDGLPPAPISLPSKQSIEAVLNYQPSDYLFMCAKEDFSGTHNFAATGAQHAANARKYVEALNARGIK